jgi:hypothetical protein
MMRAEAADRTPATMTMCNAISLGGHDATAAISDARNALETYFRQDVSDHADVRGREERGFEVRPPGP